MTETHESEEDLAAEFRALGENLRGALQAAWESEERLKLQREIESGLAGLSKALEDAAVEIKEGEAGQRLKEDIKGLHERVQSGEVQARLRNDLVTMLQTFNQELSQVMQKWSTTGPETSPPPDPAPPSEPPEV